MPALRSFVPAATVELGLLAPAILFSGRLVSTFTWYVVTEGLRHGLLQFPGRHHGVTLVGCYETNCPVG